MQQIKRERVFSGMRPTGALHLGHYLGVLDNWLELQDRADCFFMIADYHAMTTGDLSQLDLRKNTQDLLLDWLSCGIDPDRSLLFVQSCVPQHAELYVILSMLTSLGWLERNPTYKEQRSELGEASTNSLGFLGYPVLQTVDICLYQATRVPVGADQKPHLEMGRELVRRFNATYKTRALVEFEALLTKTPKLLGLDGRKMSKSYNNVIELKDEPGIVRGKVKRMLTDVLRPRRTDPGHPENCPVFSYQRIFRPAPRTAEIDRDCRSAALGCGDCKQELAEAVIAWQEPIRKRRAELEKDPHHLDGLLDQGNKKARDVAKTTLSRVFDAVRLWRG